MNRSDASEEAIDDASWGSDASIELGGANGCERGSDR
jgi:hypothetical protein